MGTVNARDLSRRTAGILDELAASGRPWLVLRRGQPVAALVAIDPDELEDWILANAPAFVRSMRQADADLRAGRVREVADVFAELDAEENVATLRGPAVQVRAAAADPGAALRPAGRPRLAAATAATPRRRTKPPPKSSKPREPSPAVTARSYGSWPQGQSKRATLAKAALPASASPVRKPSFLRLDFPGPRPSPSTRRRTRVRNEGRESQPTDGG